MPWWDSFTVVTLVGSIKGLRRREKKAQNTFRVFILSYLKAKKQPKLTVSGVIDSVKQPVVSKDIC